MRGQTRQRYSASLPRSWPSGTAVALAVRTWCPPRCGVSTPHNWGFNSMPNQSRPYVSAVDCHRAGTCEWVEHNPRPPVCVAASGSLRASGELASVNDLRYLSPRRAAGGADAFWARSQQRRPDGLNQKRGEMCSSVAGGCQRPSSRPDSCRVVTVPPGCLHTGQAVVEINAGAGAASQKRDGFAGRVGRPHRSPFGRRGGRSRLSDRVEVEVVRGLASEVVDELVRVREPVADARRHRVRFAHTTWFRSSQPAWVSRRATRRVRP